ncbi:MAG: hypothetical protein ACYC6X_03730 [Minisyncoccota bacterium]
MGNLFWKEKPMGIFIALLVTCVVLIVLILVAIKYNWYSNSEAWIRGQLQRVTTMTAAPLPAPRLAKQETAVVTPLTLEGIPRPTVPISPKERTVRWATSKLTMPVVAKHSDKTFRWRHFGADPYALTRSEAMRTRESAFRKLGLPEGAIALFVEATKKPGKKTRIVNGDHFSAMLSKEGVVHRNVLVAFIKPPVSGKMEYAAPAEKWQVVWKGRTYVLVLPEICNNWSSAVSSTNVALNRLKNLCFAYELDGRGYPVKRPLQVVVDFYNHDTADLHRLMADPCFYAQDGGTGARLRLDRECATCTPGEKQAIWPGDVSVGTKTEYVFSVYSTDGKTLGFPSGYGTVYVPYWFSTSSLWCFTAADTYWGNAPPWWGRGTWYYTSYYSFVERHELQDDLKAQLKKFHRVITPDGVLGK